VNQEDDMSEHRAIRRWLAAGLVIGATVVPSAARARFEFNPPESIPASTPAAAVGGTVARPPATSAEAGFRWGDAGVGAAGAAVLLGAGAAATGALRRRRTQHTVIG
jgi:hypothetical protein